MCKSSSLNVVYELGACGVPLRAKVEEEFIGGALPLPLSYSLSFSRSDSSVITIPDST